MKYLVNCKVQLVRAYCIKLSNNNYWQLHLPTVHMYTSLGSTALMKPIRVNQLSVALCRLQLTIQGMQSLHGCVLAQADTVY